MGVEDRRIATTQEKQAELEQMIAAGVAVEFPEEGVMVLTDARRMAVCRAAQHPETPPAWLCFWRRHFGRRDRGRGRFLGRQPARLECFG